MSHKDAIFIPFFLLLLLIANWTSPSLVNVFTYSSCKKNKTHVSFPNFVSKKKLWFIFSGISCQTFCLVNNNSIIFT